MTGIRPRPAGQDRQVRTVADASGRLVDIEVAINGRSLRMLGPAGPARELALLPSPDKLPAEPFLPVFLGAGTGTALQAFLDMLDATGRADLPVAVVDREEDILDAGGLRERFGRSGRVSFLAGPTPDAALQELTRWQDAHGGFRLLPVANPMYLRLDRPFYAALGQACEASRRAGFWETARAPRFAGAQPRILLLTSAYFLMGEIMAACNRLDIPHFLLEVPEGEVGQNEFIENLLQAVISFKPDFAFTINHLGVDKEGVLSRLLERLRLPLASWFVDNPHLILSMYTSLVSPWTAIFTWDADNLDSLAAMGFEHVRYLPLGTDVHRFTPLPQNRVPAAWRSRVSFVGNSMLHKVAKCLDALDLPPQLERTYRQVASGFGADSGHSPRQYLEKNRPDLAVLFDELGSVEAQLRYEALLTWQATLEYRLSCVRATLPFQPLIVGDSGWKTLLADASGWRDHAELAYYDQLPMFYPGSDVNFNCTSKQMKGAVNQRVFDVPATESFLITDYRNQVERLFEPGREIVCYNSPEEAEALIARYLAAPEERARIARAARTRILAEHTYDHRLHSLIAHMRAIYA